MPWQYIDINDAAEKSAYVKIFNVRDFSHSKRPPPAFLHGPYEEESLRHYHNDQYEPPVAVYVGRNLEVLGPWHAVGSLLIKDDVALVCSGIASNPTNSESQAKLEEHETALANGGKIRRKIDGQGVLVAANGHQIYGHWLVDFLPKLYLLEYLGVSPDEVKILLPRNMSGFGYQLLKLLDISDDNIVVYDPDKESIVASELFVPTTLRWGGRCSPVFADAVAYINERIDIKNRLIYSSMRKIFLSRSGSGWLARPLADEHKIEGLAVHAGFALVHPEKLSFVDQVSLFRGARKLLGQYGSGLHSTIFSRPGVVVGAMHGQLPAAFDALQSGLGERLGQLTGYVFGTPDPQSDNPYALAVAEQDFDALIESVLSH